MFFFILVGLSFLLVGFFSYLILRFQRSFLLSEIGYLDESSACISQIDEGNFLSVSDEAKKDIVQVEKNIQLALSFVAVGIFMTFMSAVFWLDVKFNIAPWMNVLD